MTTLWFFSFPLCLCFDGDFLKYGFLLMYLELAKHIESLDWFLPSVLGKTQLFFFIFFFFKSLIWPEIITCILDILNICHISLSPIRYLLPTCSFSFLFLWLSFSLMLLFEYFWLHQFYIVLFQFCCKPNVSGFYVVSYIVLPFLKCLVSNRGRCYGIAA